ncbi:hypothetical protein Asp14428_11790 [Actinoplanes sp. NBRC 14428]|nr:hypothetical protein Asp14428_11790 [Actinoplanes sp. NBRC 14428]
MHEPADPRLARGVEQHLGAEDVGGDERYGSGDRPVHMGFRREMDYCVVTTKQLPQQGGIRDVALDEP